MIQRNLVPRNPLSRRLQRHAQFATLFRATDSAPQSAYAPPLPIVGANASSTAPAQVPDEAASVVLPILPTVHAPMPVADPPQAPLTTGQGSAQASADRPAQTASLPAAPLARSVALRQVSASDSPTIDQRQLQAQASNQAVGVTARVEQPQPATPRANPNASPPPVQSEADQNWKRLQVIMRKHEEKAEAMLGNKETPAATTSHPASTLPVQRASQAQPPPTVTPAPEPGAHRPAETDNAVGKTLGQGNKEQPDQRITPAQRSPTAASVHAPRQTPAVQRFAPAAVSQPASPAQPGAQPVSTPQPPALSPGQAKAMVPSEPLAEAKAPTAESISLTDFTPATTTSATTTPATTTSATTTSATTTSATRSVDQPQVQAKMAAGSATTASVNRATLREEGQQEQTLLTSNTALAIPAATPVERQGEEAMKPLPRLAETDGGAAAAEQTMPLQAVWPVQRQESANTPNAPQGQAGTWWPELLSPVPNAAIQSALQPIPTAQPTNSALEVLPPRRPRPIVQRAAEAGGQTAPQPSATPSALQRQAPTPGSIQPASETTASDAGGNVSAALVTTDIGALPSDLWALIGQPTPPPTPTGSPSLAAPLSPAPEHAMAPHQHEPGPTAAKQAPPPAPPAAAVMHSTTAQEIQRMLFHEARQASSAAAPLPLQTATTPASPSEPEQRQGSANPVATLQAQQSAQLAQVDPPNRTKPRVTPLAVGSTAASHLADQQEELRIQEAIRRAEATGQTQPSSTQRTHTAQAGLAIQRQTTSPGSETKNLSEPTDSSGTSSQSTPEANGPDATSAVNIDELAHQVYANLKRRLFIEWERLRNH